MDIKGRKTHQTVDDALKIVEKLEHRAGKDAAGETGDGVGILLQISHGFSPKRRRSWALSWGANGTTGWGCSSSPRTTCAGIRP